MRSELWHIGRLGTQAVASRTRQAGIGRMRHAWDALQATVSQWEAKLEAEGLGVLGVGPDGGNGRKDVVSLTPAIEARVTGSVWDLSATVDAIVEVFAGHQFDTLVDGAICEMLSRRVPWHRIARTLKCSKRRVARVSRLVRAWSDQAADRRRAVAGLEALLADVRHGR